MNMVKVMAAAAALALAVGCVAQKGEDFEDETVLEREVPQTQFPIWK